MNSKRCRRSGAGRFWNRRGIDVAVRSEEFDITCEEPPPAARDGSAEGIAEFLAAGGARPWQIELTSSLLAQAVVKRPDAEAVSPSDGAGA